MIEFPCVMCGEIIKYQNSLFCSEDCEDKWIARNKRNHITKLKIHCWSPPHKVGGRHAKTNKNESSKPETNNRDVQG